MLATRDPIPSGLRGFVAACCLLVAGAAIAQAAAPSVVRLRTTQQSGSIAKYAANSDAQLPGICLEILHAVERVDPGLRFVGLETRAPLRRVERMLVQNEIDVFFCLLRSPERAQQWRYLPVPLYRIRHMVVQRVGEPDFTSLQELAVVGQKKPVLVTQGTLLAQTLARANVVTGEAPSEREALQMLLLGRADAVYGQDISLLRNIREAGLGDRLRLSATVFQEDVQYATVSKQLPPEIEQRLTLALQTLEREGQLRAIAEKYR